MTAITRRRMAYYVLAVILTIASMYAYFLVPRGSVVDSIESIFLLNVCLGSLIALALSFAGRFKPLGFKQKQEVHVDARIPTILVEIGLMVSLLYAYSLYRIPILFISIPAFFVAIYLTARGFYPLRTTFSVSSVTPLSEDWVVAFVTKRPRLREFAQKRIEPFRKLLLLSGTIGNPFVLSAKSVTYTLITAAAAPPLAIMVAAVMHNALYLLPVLAPVVPYSFWYMKLRDLAGERRTGVERELTNVSIVVHVLGSAGISLYEILTRMMEKNLFPFIRRETLLIRREVEVFGRNPLDAFEKLARTHPSKKFGSFLLGYTSKVRSGGDISTYLAGESGSFIGQLEDDWGRYVQRVSVLGGSMMIFFVVVPLLMLIMALFSPATSTYYITLYLFIAIPMFTVMLVFAVGRMQPSGIEPLRGRPLRSALVAAPTLVLSVVTGQSWIGAASALFLFSILYGYSVLDQRREMNEVDEAVPRLIGDLMEFKRQEYDIPKSVTMVAGQNSYGSSMDRFLATIASQLKVGTPLTDIKIDTGSRLAKISFHVLGEMAYSGGGSVDTLHQLGRYTSKVVEAKKNASTEMKPYLILAYLSPVLLAFGVTFTQNIVASFGSTLASGLSKLPSFAGNVGMIPPVFSQLANMLIVAASASLGVISAKITDFTVKNTFRVAINVVIAIIVTALLSQVNIFHVFFP